MDFIKNILSFIGTIGVGILVVVFILLFLNDYEFFLKVWFFLKWILLGMFWVMVIFILYTIGHYFIDKVKRFFEIF